jgi:hypothetical protein
MDVGGWLRSLGLGKYEQTFIASAIDSDVLPELTEIDFEKLGIPLGDRKRRDEGKNAEARSVLKPVFDWFAEGFDMPDLKHAKALLDQLSC